MFTKRGPVSFRNFSPHLGMVSLKIYIYLIMLQSQELHQVEEINIWKGYQIRTLQRCWVGNRGRGQGKSISLEMGLHQQHDDPDRKARAWEASKPAHSPVAMTRDIPAGKEGGGQVISCKWGSWAKGHRGRPASQTGQPGTALGGKVTWQQAVDIQLLGLRPRVRTPEDDLGRSCANRKHEGYRRHGSKAVWPIIRIWTPT